LAAARRFGFEKEVWAKPRLQLGSRLELTNCESRMLRGPPEMRSMATCAWLRGRRAKRGRR